MIKSLQITQLENMLKLLKSNVEKIDKRLNCDIVKEPKESIEVVKKKATINKKTKYIIFSVSSVAVFLVLFYFSLQHFDFSFNIPELKNPFDGEALQEYDLVNF